MLDGLGKVAGLVLRIGRDIRLAEQAIFRVRESILHREEVILRPLERHQPALFRIGSVRYQQGLITHSRSSSVSWSLGGYSERGDDRGVIDVLSGDTPNLLAVTALDQDVAPGRQ